MSGGVLRIAIFSVVVMICGASQARALAQACPPRPVCGVRSGVSVGGSFGNAGFSAGYSVQVSRAAWGGGGWCGQPSYSSCSYGCGPQWCSPCTPWGGWSFGWPGCGFGGWYGGSRFVGSQSVFIGGSGGTFFSGAVVPWGMPWWYGGGYPANWLPGCAVTPFGISCSPYATLLPAGFGPQFGPAGVLPFLGASARQQRAHPGDGPGPQVAALARNGASLAANGTSREGPRRVSTEAGRRRAGAFVAAGDRQVRAAGGDPAALRSALASYTRATAADRDSPDTFIRQAIVHLALGDRPAGDAALAKAVALDARLAGSPVPVDADPVFGGGRIAGQSPLAARGTALIAEMAAEPQGGPGELAWLAQRWSARWIDGLGGLAATGR